MIYEITVIETITKTIEVEASSAEEAQEIAQEMYDNSEIEMDSNFDDCEVDFEVTGSL